MTKLGRTLVDSTASVFTHTRVSSIGPLITLANGGIDGINLNGTDITSEIASGRVAGLVAMRDDSLPNLRFRT